LLARCSVFIAHRSARAASALSLQSAVSRVACVYKGLSDRVRFSNSAKRASASATTSSAAVKVLDSRLSMWFCIASSLARSTSIPSFVRGIVRQLSMFVYGAVERHGDRYRAGGKSTPLA